MQFAASPVMSFVPYQIDHTVTGAGKTIGLTKKRITFKFGFANPKALSEGLSGSGCRGSEHEVVFVLSLSSGKRNVMVDGREVHFSQAGSWERSFDFPFSIRVAGMGSVRARLIADSAPGAKPYDLLINDMSYFRFSKIYELGTPSMRVSQLDQRHGGHEYDERNAPPDERRAIAQAKLESLRELRAQNENPSLPPAPAPPRKSSMDRNEGNLISFDDVNQAPPPKQGVVYQASSMTMDSALHPPEDRTSSASYYSNYSTVTPQTSQQYATKSHGANPYGAQPTSQYYAQPPAAYTTPAPAAYAPAPYAQAPPTSYAQQSYSQPPPPPRPYGNPQLSFTMPPPPTMEETQKAFAPQQSYSAAPAAFASPQSQASYGSAPAFAQPPQAPPPANYGAYGYPNQQNRGAAW